MVLIAAAIMSFDALRGLALSVSIPAELAWLLPVAVDAGASVSCTVWLSPRTAPDSARFAAKMTWSLLAITVIGNAGRLGMAAAHVDPPWWVAVAVGAIAPAVVGSVVHLLVLMVRARTAGQNGPDNHVDDTARENANQITDPLLDEVARWNAGRVEPPTARAIRTAFHVGRDRSVRILDQLEAVH